MRVTLTVAAASAALALSATAVSAQPTPAYSAHDLQCFIATSSLADGSNDAAITSNGMMAAMYFAGKLYGASPHIDITAALDAESDKMTAVDMGTLLKECGAELETHGHEIEAAGRAMQAKGK